MTGVSYKSALFMMHRIRWAMGGGRSGGKLDGTVEVDETYVGGVPRKKTRREKKWRVRHAPDVRPISRTGRHPSSRWYSVMVTCGRW